MHTMPSSTATLWLDSLQEPAHLEAPRHQVTPVQRNPGQEATPERHHAGPEVRPPWCMRGACARAPMRRRSPPPAPTPTRPAMAPSTCTPTSLSRCRCACRSIERAGGLDRWLLHTPDAHLHSDVGSALKFRIGLLYKQRQHEQRRHEKRLQLEGQQPALGAGHEAGAGAAALVDGSQSRHAGRVRDTAPGQAPARGEQSAALPAS